MAGFRLVDLDLPPDVFAVVMATGVISVAAGDHSYPRLGRPLAVLATASFVLLSAGLALRVLARSQLVRSQARDPDVALRMFTFVAAATVLAARWSWAAWAAWVLGGVAVGGWLVLVPLAVRDVRSRPRTQLRDQAHGAWLLPSVATSGLSITAADLAASHRITGLLLVGGLLWLVGLALYLAVTALIAWRARAAPVAATEVTPDSWILMGGLAILTLAGDHLLGAIRVLGGSAAEVDATQAVTLLCWVLASAWIPMLVYAEVWSVDRRAGSLRYHGVWWAAVFPLGMYATATAATALGLHLRSLRTISLVFFWIAMTVWLVVAVGMAHRALAVRGVRSRRAMR